MPDNVMDEITSSIESAVTTVTTVDTASSKLKELVKLANFDVDGIWDDAVHVAKVINADTNAVRSAAADSLDTFDRLGRVLKIFGHDVEGVWDSLVALAKKHA